MAQRTKIIAITTFPQNLFEPYSEVKSLPNTLTLNGSVTAGEGNGKKYVELYWVKVQIQEKLGYTAYPGTLNIKLTQESVNQKKLLKNNQAIQICPAEGYCFGAVFKATLNNLECAIVIPEVKGYPENILEIIAPFYLREALNLKNGTLIAVTICI
jgi:riboflavin kinase